MLTQVEAKMQVLTLPGYISICIFQFEYFVLCSFVLYSMVFCNRFVFECFVSNIRLLLKPPTYQIISFTVLIYFTSNVDSVIC